MIKKVTYLILSVFLFGVMQIKAQDDRVIDQVIWIVGDEVILKSDVEKERMMMLYRGDRMAGDPYCFIPEQIAVQKLFLDQAKIDSIEVANSQVVQEVSRYEKMLIMNIGSKEKVEENFGAPIVELRKEWMESLKNERLVSEVQRNLVKNKVKLTPSEVRKFYNELPKDSLPFIQTSVEVQVIMTEPVVPLAEIDKIKSRLRDFTNQIQSGQANFSTLAIMYSEDLGTAKNGGEMGFTGRAQLVPEFASAVFAMNDPNKISNIVETEFGYHIIQLIERRGDLVNFRHILLKPRVPQEEINKAITRMDSLLVDIRDEKVPLTFEQATYFSSDKDTRNNHGLMVNHKESPYYGTARFRLEDLPTEMANVVKDMKVGDISAPFHMKLEAGKDVVAIIKLRSRVEGHVANISDDYQALKTMVENRKQQEVIKKWLQDKIKKTYVYIEDSWKNCDFKYEGWVRKD